MTQQIAAVPAGPDSQPVPDRAGFEIIPRRGLIAVAVVLAGLVAVIAANSSWGATLAVLVATLLVFAVDVPLILAFTVTRDADPGPAAADPRTR